MKSMCQIGVGSVLFVLVATFVTGCGGGGGKDTSTSPPPPNLASVPVAQVPLTGAASGSAAHAAETGLAKAREIQAGFGDPASHIAGASLAATEGSSGNAGGSDGKNGSVPPRVSNPAKGKSAPADNAGGSAGSGGGGFGAGGLGNSKADLVAAVTPPVPANAGLGDTTGAGYGGGGGHGGGGGSDNGGINLGAGGGGPGGGLEVQNFEGGGAQGLSGSHGQPALGTEDPADYFNRIGLNENLFKRVERRYGQKTRAWALQDSREMLPKRVR